MTMYMFAMITAITLMILSSGGIIVVVDRLMYVAAVEKAQPRRAIDRYHPIKRKREYAW